MYRRRRSRCHSASPPLHAAAICRRSPLHSNLEQRQKLPVWRSSLCHLMPWQGKSKVRRAKRCCGTCEDTPASYIRGSTSIFVRPPHWLQFCLHVEQELQSPTQQTQQTRLVGSPQSLHPVPSCKVPLLWLSSQPLSARWGLAWPLQVPKLARVAPDCSREEDPQSGLESLSQGSTVPRCTSRTARPSPTVQRHPLHGGAVGRTSLEARGQVQWSGWCKPQEGEGPASLNACNICNSPKRPAAARQVG